MLVQAGLDDIIHIRPRGQIAYLLVERARLMDMLEEWQNFGAAGAPDGATSARQPNARLMGPRRDAYEVRPLLL